MTDLLEWTFERIWTKKSAPSAIIKEAHFEKIAFATSAMFHSKI
jgi:hypothetical protein